MRRNFKILIVKLSALGDIIHALGAVSIVKRKIPESKIYWLTKKQYLPLFEGIHFIDNVITDVYQVVFKRFDVIIDLQGLIKSSWFLPFVFSPCKAGFSWKDLREFMAGFFYTKRFETFRIHIVEKMRDIICQVLGVEDDGIYDFGIKPQSFDLNLPESFGLIFPSAAWENKKLEAFWCKKLLDTVEEKIHIPVFVLPGKGDYKRLRDVLPNSRIFPSWGLKESIYVISKASFAVGPDTGFLHIAAALGVPVVSLFCPTDPLRNGPYTEKKVIVECDCPSKGCFRRKCFKNCTSSIPVHTVSEVLLSNLEKWGVI